MSKVTAIIQARMGSQRLPGKSLRELAGKPIVMHVVNRALATQEIDKVVVATTTNTEDDALASFLESREIAVYRGDADDVLGRYAGAARAFGGEVIVRLTGDDPLKDPKVIALVLKKYLDNPDKYDYVSNTIDPTFPEGQDTEVIRASCLFDVAKIATEPYDREHVTPYFYNNKEKFRCYNVTQESNLSHFRWTLDTEQDMCFFESVFSELGGDHNIGMNEVLALLESKPQISKINASEKRSARYANIDPKE